MLPTIICLNYFVNYNSSKDVKELTYALINRFGSLEGVLNADANQLMTVNGIGQSAAVGIKW